MVGQTISHYKVVEKLGEGGMGVVYKAEDTSLARPVALKFLAARLVADEDVRKRFEREAKASAALNHPNICTVYEIAEADGHTFIAMAFLEGEGLDKKIEAGPLKIEDALDIAVQVAQGLDTAHARRIVHRDIKPANLMITGSGSKKLITIMDFGLAQLADRSKLTRENTTLGTVAYMSPEQTYGDAVDHRADIWSLGVMIYEMVTGQRPFRGHYDKAIMYSITSEEPEPMTSLRSGVPMELELLVNKALAKAPERRYQSTAEMAVDLESLGDKLKSAKSSSLKSQGGIQATAPQPLGITDRIERRQRLQRRAVLVLLAASLALSALLWFRGPPSNAPRQPVRFSLTPENLVTFRSAPAVISPDGRRIVFVAVERGERTLWVRDLDQETPRKLEGTEEAEDPFWSPDSQSIGFGTETELKRVSLSGAAPMTLCDLPRAGAQFLGGAWSPDGEQIVYSAAFQLFQAPSRGGTPKLLFEPEESERDRHIAFIFPFFLPATGGSRGLIYAYGPGSNDRKLGVIDLETGERRELVPGTAPVYSASGHLIYQDSFEPDAGLRAAPFSLDTLTVTGESFPVVESGRHPSVAQNGTLVYLDGAAGAGVNLVWRDRVGKRLGTIGQAQEHIEHLALSPDSGSVAVEAWEADGNRDIWVHDAARGTKTRLTTDPAQDSNPAWSPSGEEIIFDSDRGGGDSIYAMPAGGGGEAVALLAEASVGMAPDWSHDGKFVIYWAWQVGDTGGDLWFLKPKADGKSHEATPYLKTAADDRIPVFSPNGRYVAYVSSESGRHEVYVRPFPEGEGKWLVSINGGAQPRWSRDGEELFYVEEDQFMAVSVSTADGFSLGAPKPLFRDRWLTSTFLKQRYDVSSDGERFVLREEVEAESGKRPAIRVVENWFAGFQDREQD